MIASITPPNSPISTPPTTTSTGTTRKVLKCQNRARSGDISDLLDENFWDKLEGLENDRSKSMMVDQDDPELEAIFNGNRSPIALLDPLSVETAFHDMRQVGGEVDVETATTCRQKRPKQRLPLTTITEEGAGADHHENGAGADHDENGAASDHDENDGYDWVNFNRQLRGHISKYDGVKIYLGTNLPVQVISIIAE